MVLFGVAGLAIGKALVNAVQRRGAPEVVHTVARTSAMMAGSDRVLRERRRATAPCTEARTNPYSRDEIRNRLGGTSIRRLHNQAAERAADFKEALENETWYPIYRFPGVRFGVLLARAKLLQTIASVLYLPYCGWGALTGTMDTPSLVASVVVAVAAPTLLFIFSRYLNRLVGVVSTNKNGDCVRIGYLTFWGSRKNKYLELSDLLPLSETASSKHKVAKLQWYGEGSSNFLFISTRNCEIIDEQRAETVFGDLAIFETTKKS